MKINLDLDEETADSFVCNVLQYYIEIEEETVSKLKRLTHPKSFQKEDLADSIILLEHLAAVHQYFGGNIK